MKKNINPIAIAAAIIAVIVIILVFVGMNRHKNDAGTQPDSSSVSESVASSEDNLASAETANDKTDTAIPENTDKDEEVIDYVPEKAEVPTDIRRGNTDADAVSSAANIPAGSDTAFVEFATLEEDNSATFRYTDRYVYGIQKTYFEMQKDRQESYNLTSSLSSGGNVELAFGTNPLYTGTDKNGIERQYIISGADVLEYDGTLDPFKTHPILRKEGTSERVYLFDSKEKRDEFLALRKIGKNYLENGSTDSDWKIVLNGEYIPDAFPMIDEDGNLNVSIAQLAMAYNPLFSHVTGNYVYAATDWGLYTIPNDEADPIVKNRIDQYTDENGHTMYLVSDDGFGGTSATYGGVAQFPKTKQYYWVTPDDLYSILGWKTSIKGRVISIVSDPLDDSDLTAVVETVASGTIDLNGNNAG